MSVPSGRVKSISTSGRRHRCANIGSHRQSANLRAERGAAGRIERRSELERTVREGRFHQRAPHLAAPAMASLIAAVSLRPAAAWDSSDRGAAPAAPPHRIGARWNHVAQHARKLPVLEDDRDLPTLRGRGADPSNRLVPAIGVGRYRRASGVPST